MAYVTVADIKDRLIKPIVQQDVSYLTEADTALTDLAAALDVDSDDIADPVHYRVKKYLVAWICHEVCRDNKGLSPQKLTEQGVQDDPYDSKLGDFKKELTEWKSQITSEIIKDEADEPKEYAKTSMELYRA